MTVCMTPGLSGKLSKTLWLSHNTRNIKIFSEILEDDDETVVMIKELIDTRIR